jgi:signal transduction histidine kinase
MIEAFRPPSALLDRCGEVLAGNRAWRAASQDGRGACAVGENYLDWLRDDDAVGGGEVLARGVAGVLCGLWRSHERICRLGPTHLRVCVRQIDGQAPPLFLISLEDYADEVGLSDDRVMAAQQEERQRLAGELHDSVGQNLVALTLNLTRLRNASPPEPALQGIVDEMAAALQQTHAEIRTLSFLLQPPWEDAGGSIETALRDLATGFARRAGLQVDARIDRLRSTLCRRRQLTLFRILQEALVNVHRHARASAVEVELQQRPRHIILKVRDDGRGIQAPDGARLCAGVGLKNMRARLHEFGGDLLIVSDGSGTTLTAKLPV